MENRLNIYLLEQDINKDYGSYDSCVVIAESEDQARNTYPSGEWDYDAVYYWVPISKIDKIKVTLIGTALEGADPGVVCASFHAG